MWARRIVRWTLVLILLTWVPDRPSEPAPIRHAPRPDGAWIDLGLRVAPDRPWSSWRVYLDLHVDAPRRADRGDLPVPSGTSEQDTAEPELAVELGAEELSRAVGGLLYALLREVVDRVLPGNTGR